MEGLLAYWPVLLAGVAVVVFAVRQESIGRQNAERYDAIVVELKAVYAQIKIQNGRVGALERWQAYENGRHGFPLNGHTEGGK